MSAPNDLILFHYPFSPYARRITWYLALRGISYAQCIQPPVLPRPDLEALGVSYRRIPLLSHGRDIYLDTRLILRKLEEKFPDGKLGSSEPSEQALEKLLEAWTVESGVFNRAAGLIPTSSPVMKDEKFKKDREGFSGRSWGKESLEKARPENLVGIRRGFELLEEGLLADGREWILKGDKPSLADIEAIWPFDWLDTMPGALPSDVISKKQFPKVFAWIERFRAVVKAAKSKGPKTVTLKGQEAVKSILSSGSAEPNGVVDSNDALAFKEGDEVELYPTDSGFTHRDRGRLITLTPNEVVVASRSTESNKELRIHAPRSGFRITRIGGSKL